MAAKKKPAYDTDTWIVTIDGTPTEVAAQSLELAAEGIVFSTGETIVRAVAPGHWSTVELKPPPPETAEA